MKRTCFGLANLFFAIRLGAIFLGTCMAGAAPAQTPPPPLVSPEVRSDRSVTFRFRGPNDKEVAVFVEGAAKPLPMQKDDQGVWSVTTEPLAPDYYGYTIIADGVGLFDPSNHVTKPNLLGRSSVVHVPGPASLSWEAGAAPHGEIHRHFYKSGVVGDDRDFFVYTPPGYDPRGKQTYPVLYLLHGFSDDASAWTAVGRANVILDKFGWIGAFSSGGITEDFEKEFPAVDSKATGQLHLLWIACGTDDRLIDINRKFRAWLASKNIKHVDIETPGAHTWMVWRRNLTEFSSLLFR